MLEIIGRISGMSDDLISRSSLTESLIHCNGLGRKSFELVAEVIKNIPTIYDADKVVEQLEDLKKRYWLTIANSGDEKLDCAYENVGNALDMSTKIVRSGGVNDKN